MKKTLDLKKLVGGIVLLILAMWGIAWLFSIHPRKIHDESLIGQLESSSPSYHSDVKEDLSKLIQKELKVEPEKVAFFVYAPHEASSYYIKVYYKKSEKWYGFRLGWTSSQINSELDEKLWRIALGG